MWKKDFPVSVWSVLVLVSSVRCSAWKPIAPPPAYYAPQPAPCLTDCDLKYKFPFIGDSGGSTAESQMKSTLLSQFNQESSKDHYQSNQKLDLDIFKPTEVTFYPGEQGKTFNSPLSTYQEVLRHNPTTFFSFNTYGVPQKPTKTIYYGDLELAKPKLSADVKYYKPYKQSPTTGLKIFKQANFIDNEVASFRPLTAGSSFDEHCSLYKVSFRQDPFYQYIQYKVHMPKLKEFTLCLWTRFHNHSHDHSLFSYAVKHHPKAIYMWVSNLNDPGFFSLKIMGQTIFRLNFPVKLYHWYHTCQSWNGNTGEWQVWVNSHRIARGFHNLLVGHSIPGGGVAISGQEHRHFGKGFLEVPHYLKGSGGLEGEITMLQVYKVALTAGKAYNDHTHHHSHYTSTTTEPPELPTEEPSTTTDHPFLENGQLKKHINVLELAEALKNKGHLESAGPSFELHGDPLHPNPFVGHIAPLPVHGNNLNYLTLSNHAVFKRNDESKAKKTVRDVGDQEPEKESPGKIKFLSNVSGQVQVEKVKYSIRADEVTVAPEMEARGLNVTSEEPVDNFTGLYDDEDLLGEEKTTGFREGRTRLRRHHSRRIARPTSIRPKRISPGEAIPGRYYRPKKRGDALNFLPKDEKAGKRHIVFEDPFFSFGLAGHDPQSPFGGLQPSELSYDQFPQFEPEDIEHADEDPPAEQEQKKEVELAEGEVRRIMELCSGCQSDPFRKVAVISWRSTPKKIFSGALFLKAKSQCDNF